MERSRSRSQSFYEEEEEDNDSSTHSLSGTPMPDINFLTDCDDPPPAPGQHGEEDDVDESLDNIEQVQDDRRRSRSFFDQTDVACGLKSALPPAEPTGK